MDDFSTSMCDLLESQDIESAEGKAEILVKSKELIRQFQKFIQIRKSMDDDARDTASLKLGAKLFKIGE